MRRVRWLLVLGLLLIPAVSHALQLHWSSGADTLTFTEATRAMLVLRADSAEVTLPPEWRLLWVGDSTEVEVVALDSLEVCEGDTARVYGVDGPSTPEDSTAHRVTAHFCSGGSGATERAAYALDLPAWGRGKCKVVALDPADSSHVLESNEVTFNGGVSDTFPPVVLLAMRSHPSTELRVRATGFGLARTAVVQIAAMDGSWQLPMVVVERDSNSVVAVANVAADLPHCLLRVGTESGLQGSASLDADTASALQFQPACTDEMKEINSVTHEDIQPKDFTIIASRDSFHVFYTRQDYNLGSTPWLDSKVIGHKRSRDLYSWFPTEHTMNSVVARYGLWDSLHVWAPSIVKKPGDITYHMLYTGVDVDGVQRIGMATSTDLNVWTQDSTAIYQSSNVTWALQGTPEFRDAFVMSDTDSVHYLMYFVTKTQARGRYVVGVARTTDGAPGDLRLWTNPQPLWNTDLVHTGEAVIESPHAFKDPGGRWWLFYTGYNSTSDPAYVDFETNDYGPADLDSTRWSAPDTLYEYLGGDQKVQYWHASEYYRWAPGYQYLMGFNDSEHSVSVSQVSWHGQHSFVLTDSCPPKSVLDVAPSPRREAIELRVLGPQPGKAPLTFRVHVPARMRVQLAIYDIAGRRVRTLLDGELPAGEQEVRWDGRGGSGDVPGAGVYFARLSAVGGRRIAKLVLLR